MSSRSRRNNRNSVAPINQKPTSNNNRSSLLLHAEKRSEIRSGPIPSPDDLSIYNNIIPNGADRIMRMAESQAEHRQQLEKMAMQSNIVRSKSGQLFGFLLNLVALFGFIFLAATQSQIEGMIGTLATLILGLVYYWVVYKNRQKELEKNSTNKIPEK
jgi:uncharacterized membrane protein